MLSLTTFADELEREKACQPRMTRCPGPRGHVTGSRVFGYDNLEVRDAEGGANVARRINDAQAVVVRRIFDACAAGQGLRTIARR